MNANKRIDTRSPSACSLHSVAMGDVGAAVHAQITIINLILLWKHSD